MMLSFCLSYDVVILSVILSVVHVSPDPQVKVAGTPTNIQRARELILQDLDAKSTRVTLKLDVAFSEHSHVIGKEGANIKKGVRVIRMCAVFSLCVCVCACVLSEVYC